MQTSIKEIVEGIKNVAQVYFTDEIKFVSFNQFPTSEFDKNCIGLIYYVDSYPSSVNTSKVSIRLEFLDLINTMSDIDESKLEAFSDTQGVGAGFVQYLDRNGYYIDEAVTQSLIEPKTNNGVGGTEFIVTFNYLKDCFITGDGYKFKALTIGKTIDSDSNFLVNISDVTENNSGLAGLFKSASTPDTSLNLTLNEAKTQLTIQTDVTTTRFSNVNFTASNGIVNSSAVIVNSIAFNDPILAFSPINVWDSEHINVSGTTTTLYDYNEVGVQHNLTNPAASNQPTFNASSANFNSKPSFTFDGVSDYVRKTVSGYRPTDTSGVFISVYRLISGIQICDITVSDTTATNRYIFNQINTDTLRVYVLNGSTVSFRGSTNINDTNSKVVAYGTSGSVYKQWVGTTAQTINMISGVNNGAEWLNDPSSNGYNNLTIGALERTSLAYSNLEWCFSGYFPYVDDSTILSILTLLKAKYGIN